MAKVLRVLVIIILILSAVSLFFAHKLFEKRELLTKRNSVLEETLIKVAKTIEGQDPAEADAPSVMKDTSEVSDRELTNPEKQAMLEGYPIKLEQQNLPTLDFGNTEKRLQLRCLYRVDGEGNYILNPGDNKPDTKGPGTMQELMDQLFDRAKAQQASLNKTRAELSKMRDQFTASIDEINKLKTDGRAAKVELKGEKEKVATLTTENSVGNKRDPAHRREAGTHRRTRRRQEHDRNAERGQGQLDRRSRQTARAERRTEEEVERPRFASRCRRTGSGHGYGSNRR